MKIDLSNSASLIIQEEQAESYLPYKVYTLLITMRVIRMNMNLFYAFVIMSFLNRCLNPFIYASQYEEVQVHLLIYASQYEEVHLRLPV